MTEKRCFCGAELHTGGDDLCLWCEAFLDEVWDAVEEVRA